MRMASCPHLSEIRTREAHTEGCEECLKIGDSWVHLRVCLVCGKTGCCDNSKNRHASAHFHETGHPMMRSKEPDETWGWCYIDRKMFDPI
jgi:uncharacterized UBP type Zn finger protein